MATVFQLYSFNRFITSGVPGEPGDRERRVGAVARLRQPGEAGRRGRIPVRRGLLARGGHGHAAAGRQLQARPQGLGGPAGQVGNQVQEPELATFRLGVG